MGRIHYRLSKARRKALAALFSRAFPEEQDPRVINEWVLDYFINHYVDRMSIFHYRRLDRNNLRKVIEIDGLELLDATLSQGKGCVLVHGHIGPSQLPLIGLGILEYPMTQLGFRSNEGLSFIGKHAQLRHRIRIEEGFPAEMLYVDKFQRQVFKSLAAGRVVMVAGDGSGNKRRFGLQRRREFLNHRMDFPLGPFRLAIKSGAPMLFLFLERDGPFHYRATIQASMPQPGQQDAIAEDELQDAFVTRLGRSIAANPGLWQFWDQL